MLPANIIEIIEDFLHFDISQDFELVLRPCRYFMIYTDGRVSPIII